MSQDKVSVYVLTCNQRSYIRQCLNSVLEQQCDVALQVLVGDDSSDDGTSAIIAELAAANPAVITHIRHPIRLGAVQNCQALLRYATGQYLAHLDGDDYWLPGKLQRQVDFMRRNPECVAVYANALTIAEDGTPLGLFNGEGAGRYDLAAMLRRGNFLNTSSMLFRASLKTVLLEMAPPFIDYKIHLRFSRHGFLAQLREPLVGYRVNAIGSMVSSSNDLVRELYWEAIRDVPLDLVTDVDLGQGMADFLRRVSFRAVRTRRLGLLREWMPRVIEASPYGVARTLSLTLLSVVRVAAVEILSRLKALCGRRHARVLYHR